MEKGGFRQSVSWKQWVVSVGGEVHQTERTVTYLPSEGDVSCTVYAGHIWLLQELTTRSIPRLRRGGLNVVYRAYTPILHWKLTMKINTKSGQNTIHALSCCILYTLLMTHLILHILCLPFTPGTTLVFICSTNLFMHCQHGRRQNYAHGLYRRRLYEWWDWERAFPPCWQWQFFQGKISCNATEL